MDKDEKKEIIIKVLASLNYWGLIKDNLLDSACIHAGLNIEDIEKVRDEINEINYEEAKANALYDLLKEGRCF